MAIVQISRIQHRRGTGEPPQLASGEIAWSLDNQKLYIGSGSVSEGAPAVANIEVLTEKTDILDLANQYAFRNLLNTTALTFQQKLDQNVTVLDFGAQGDGVTNDAPAFQAAIDTLYLNSTPDEKMVLRVPAGEYKLNDVVYIPPFVSLVGDGVENTIINGVAAVGTDDDAPVFRTVTGAAQPSGPYLFDEADTQEVDTPQVNQARHIEISGMTINQGRQGSALYLDQCARSVFRDLYLTSEWQDDWNPAPGDPTPVEANSIAILLKNSGGIAPCKENVFENIVIHDFLTGTQILHDYANYNTFRSIQYKYMKNGIILGDQGNSYAPSHNHFEGCTFDLISNEAIKTFGGEYNISSNNKFLNVGVLWNATLPDLSTPQTDVIDFVDTYTNQSINDYFQRFVQLATYDPSNAEYKPEVNGRVDYTNQYRNETTIGYTLIQEFDVDGFPIGVLGERKEVVNFAAIPNQTIFVDYLYVGSDDTPADPVYHRKEGTIKIHYHSDRDTPEVIFEDNGAIQTNKTENLNETDFSVELVDDSTERRIILYCKSLISSEVNFQDTFTYKVRIKS